MADAPTNALAALVRRTGETLYEYLERRERELMAQAAALRSDLAAIEAELAHVKSSRSATGNISSYGRTPSASTNLLATNIATLPNSALSNAFVGNLDKALGAGFGSGLLANIIGHGQTNALFQPAKSEPPTIKDMILKALWTGFRDTGATPAQLRQFIRDAYGRDIDRTSMSPQITRLRMEGMLKQKGGEDNWRLTLKAIGQFNADMRYGA